MNLWKKLFGGETAAPSVAKLDGDAYFNKEWNFGITIPKGWKTVFENDGGYPWLQPLRISGPKASRGQPFLSVLAAIVQEDGKGIQGYMDKAERDLCRGFSGFSLDAKREKSILGFPVAWMTYGYRIDSGQRKEINATAFFGQGRQLLLQFICETDSECEQKDFPLFESVINTFRVGSAGIRHPNVSLAGSSTCELCQKSLSGGGTHSMLNLKLKRLIPVCDACRNAD